MCGISGVYLSDPEGRAAEVIHESLFFLQHRGQDAAGIVSISPSGAISAKKGTGLVREVFSGVNLPDLKGNIAIGHVRYPTSGFKTDSETQPFYVNYPYGIYMAHNGNVTNTAELRGYLVNVANRHLTTTSDSELLLNLLAHLLVPRDGKALLEEDMFVAMKKLFSICRGGYTCVGFIPNFGLFGFRDPNGIRPLVCGRRVSKTGEDYMLSSETAGFNIFQFGEDYFDLEPGEVVVITERGMSRKKVCSEGVLCPDIFEYIYFARPDSTIDGVSVYDARIAMGNSLAESIKSRLDVSQIDCVIAVPDTGRLSALQISERLGIKYREGFLKNRYIGRTFIMPTQEHRIVNIKRKLTPIKQEIKGKSVLLIDDSIVRGTTLKEIITMIREAGVKRVYVASCAPPIKFPNVYGIDIPTRVELVAWNRTEEDVCKIIGADALIFQEIDKLTEAIRTLNSKLKFFDLSPFNGSYITGDVDEEYIRDLETRILEGVRRPLKSKF